VNPSFLAAARATLDQFARDRVDPAPARLIRAAVH
jgi:hypothetical protein